VILLVTGCAGFIGWKVSERLLSEGHTVIGVDNLDSAYQVRLKEWRLLQLQPAPRFIFHRISITDRQALAPLFQEYSVDGIINLAARAGVRASLEDPWAYYETNVRGTLNLLDACREYGISKFVLSSTSSLYASRNPRPYREDADTDQPLSPYAASKKAAEELCYVYHHLYGLDITVLRYFTVYGPAGRPDMAVLRFIKWIAEGEPLVLYGDGGQQRDFTYIDDIAIGTILGLKALGFEVINLGADRPVAVRKLIELLQTLLGRNALIQPQPMHPADVLVTWADISKARSQLGWVSEITLEEGLRRAVDWYMENRVWLKEILD
jgi:nucleoside-diphosphate-sugar epimerase